MAENTEMTSVLTQLSSIAHAPMTADQREKRAEPVLSAGEATVDGICDALQDPALKWNVAKARAYDLPVARWMEAVDIACTPPPTSLGQLLDGLHKAESAVSMLKAGYRAQRDGTGRLTWVRPQSAGA